MIAEDLAKLDEVQKAIDEVRAKIPFSDEVAHQMAELLENDQVERTGDPKKDLLLAYLMATAAPTRN
jgi:hypothetical protein